MDLNERLGGEVFFLDGAMGTQLIAAGAKERCNDYLNVKSPDIVKGIHLAYFNAGCDAVITNTFGANCFVLGKHGLGGEVANINIQGAKVAKAAAEQAGGDRYVLGDIGPCGDFLPPVGKTKPEDVKAAFVAQAEGLAEGGVDGFIIETMSAVEEVVIAVEAVKSVSKLPVLVSLAYNPAGDGFKTIMGVGPDRVVSKLADLGVTAIGFNCGSLTMEQYVKLAGQHAEVLAESGVLLLAEPNAGKPELTDDAEVVYNLSAEDFAAAGEDIYRAGAMILGGCCGTTPEHIEEMVKRVRA